MLGLAQVLQDIGANDIVILTPRKSLSQVDLFQIRHSEIAIIRPGERGLLGTERHPIQDAGLVLLQVLAQHTWAAAQIEHTGARLYLVRQHGQRAALLEIDVAGVDVVFAGHGYGNG
ncbi:hypothetical protein GCM10027195_13110 [Comamonas sediminis]